MLKERRAASRLNQTELGERLAGETQTFVSKCERGERRLDMIDTLDFLAAMNTSPTAFLNDLLARLGEAKSPNAAGPRAKRKSGA